MANDRLGGLKIFDLNLRGYSGTGSEVLRRLQTLDGGLPDGAQPPDRVEEEESSDKVSDCDNASVDGDVCKDVADMRADSAEDEPMQAPDVASPEAKSDTAERDSGE